MTALGLTLTILIVLAVSVYLWSPVQDLAPLSWRPAGHVSRNRAPRSGVHRSRAGHVHRPDRRPAVGSPRRVLPVDRTRSMRRAVPRRRGVHRPRRCRGLDCRTLVPQGDMPVLRTTDRVSMLGASSGSVDGTRRDHRRVVGCRAGAAARDVPHAPAGVLVVSPRRDVLAHPRGPGRRSHQGTST
jgi:hypothetical protein